MTLYVTNIKGEDRDLEEILALALSDPENVATLLRGLVVELYRRKLIGEDTILEILSHGEGQTIVGRYE